MLSIVKGVVEVKNLKYFTLVLFSFLAFLLFGGKKVFASYEYTSGSVVESYKDVNVNSFVEY